MKEINLKDAMRAYCAYDEAFDAQDAAFRWMLDCVGGVWETSSRERYEQAKNRMTAAEQEMTAAADAALYGPITDVQGRCTARTITPADVLDALLTIEQTLRIPKRAMEGIYVCVDVNAQKFPNAYKYTPESTIFEAYYKASSWRVTLIHRATTHAPSRRYEITHTDESKAALLRRFESWE